MGWHLMRKTTAIRGPIEAEGTKDGKSVDVEITKITERLTTIQDAPNKLTRTYADELLDEDGYQAASAELAREKATLKKQ